MNKFRKPQRKTIMIKLSDLLLAAAGIIIWVGCIIAAMMAL